LCSGTFLVDGKLRKCTALMAVGELLWTVFGNGP